ncbi:MAG: tRNA epoxyqueuosine(34) reductase QueG [Actinomycetota bacterium]|nr:tRNA epoxyqueuosine(34) reductase QueG [Actinomycetota bacterium]
MGLTAGLDAVGITAVTPFAETRHHLEERRAAGLHGGMAFTYRNPARSTDPARILGGARAIVVGARRYPSHRRAETPADSGHPTGAVARYASADHYGPLRLALGAVADRLREDGWQARVVADDNALVDREAAHRAGLGWYGKNTNLLLPGQGSWFVLGSVVTDAPLPAPVEVLSDGCGTCRRCLPGCPTGALVAPGVLDARRCLAWLLQAPGVFPVEYRVALGGRMYGCDDCQEVCPENLVAARGDKDGRLDPGPADQPGVDLLEVLGASDEQLLARLGRWYIPERQPRYLRRNALVALGNTADGRHPAVAQALHRALGDPDPLIRGHAVWAAARLGRRDLLTAVTDDPDPDVCRELELVAADLTKPPGR